MTKATDLSRPQPRAGHHGHRGLCARQERGAGGVAKVHKLSSNENPLGASPKAIEAVREVAGKLEFYPDGAATRLREAIGEAHGLNPANIVCSNGSDEILGLLAQTYLVARRRGDLHRARLPGLQDLHPGGRRDAGRRPRKPTSAPMSTRSSPR